MGRLHCQRHANTECRQRHHRRGADTDEHHLPEDWRDLEKLPGKGRNQNPVEQTEIKLEIIFHLPLERAECQGARVDESRNFRALVTNRFASSGSTHNTMAQSEIDKVRALLRSKPRPVGWAERRQRLDDIGSVWPVADDVKLESVDVDALGGEWSIAPNSDPSRVLMFFHGGGYCSGSIVSHRRMITEAGRAAGTRTLAIAYRLAPEHPFPAAYDDALTGWRFLRNEGIPAKRIAVGGDSAGAGLAIALIGQLRDAHDECPVCAWLVSPWTDLTMSGSTFASKDAVDPIIHKEYLNELADAYLLPGMDKKDPRVSPLYANLTGFSPLLIQVGSAETLLDDATRFASVAGAADVRVTLEIWPRMIHAWPLWNAHLEAGRRALANAGAFIRAHL
jgi:monoterpene epsilon-lactone hydrolase